MHLTEEHLQIPYRLACRYQRSEALDELVSVGNLALVEAATRWRAEHSHNGEAGYGPYLVRGVWMAIQIHLARRRRWARGGRCDPAILAYTHAAPPEPPAGEMDEVIRAILAHVCPVDRTVLRLTVLEGLTGEQAGKVMGC